MPGRKNISTLRAWRTLQGRTLADAAREIGISPPHLSRLERGIRGPSEQVLERLSAVTGSPVEKLFEADI